MPKTCANEPEPDRAAVTDALERVLAQPEIARSPQLAQFLSYIVSRTLEGQSQAIKAYSIAVDVFGRPADFDPQNDPIVRVQARRLRALLDEYYSGAGKTEVVRIVLPTGRYVPEFARVAQSPSESIPVASASAAAEDEKKSREPAPWFRKPWLAGIALVCLAFVGLGVAAWFWQSWGRSAESDVEGVRTPLVAVGEFQTLSDVAELVPRVSGLALEIVTDLAQFETIDAAYLAPSTGALEQRPPDFVLSGVVRIEGNAVEYSAILTDPQTGSVVWNHALSLSVEAAQRAGALDEISRMFSTVLGSARGPIHREARELLRGPTGMSGRETSYLCRVAFELYRGSGAAEDARRTKACFETLSAEEQTSAAALAATAILNLEVAEAEASLDVRLAEAAEQLQRAVALSPTSALVWEQLARWREAQGDIAQARAAYGASIQLNPARADALAGFAQLLAFSGGYEEAEPLAAAALRSPDPPAWYFGVPALLALRDGDYERALEAAERYEEADRELGPILALMALQGGANGNVISRYLPQIMEEPAFRRSGILPRLRLRISDNALVDNIRNALVQAGVPVQALISGF
jgi:tetratricopeptide (TPR) repeat protein